MFGQTTSSALLLLCQGLEKPFSIPSTLCLILGQEGGGHRAYPQAREQGAGLMNNCQEHFLHTACFGCILAFNLH